MKETGCEAKAETAVDQTRQKAHFKYSNYLQVLVIIKFRNKTKFDQLLKTMKKLIFFALALFTALALISPQNTYANERLAGASATLVSLSDNKNIALDTRVKAIENVFKKHNSPLVEESRYFVEYADKYGVDWKLLPAISGLESSFGRRLMPGSHNAYGWGGGHIYFDSWEDGINTINKALAEKYVARGAKNVWEIGPIYAESPTWAVRVNSFMNKIDSEYVRLSTFAITPTI